MTLPPFAILYADPPWRFRTWRMGVQAQHGEAWARRQGLPPYDCMNTADICTLPVPTLCAPDCILFLWTIYPMLPDAFQVISAWGFRYKTTAFTWIKQNPSGIGFHLGMGLWTRANPELCLLATRGHPRRVSRSVPNLVIAPRREHSRKPDEVRERIVELCGNLPRAELFARQKTPGWHVWGDQVESDFSFPLPSRQPPLP